MTEDSTNTDPLFAPEPAPDHEPGFWNRLDDALSTQTRELTRTVTRATSQPLVDPTEKLPPVTSLRSRDDANHESHRTRVWPLAAAAAVLAVLGIGFLAVRSPQAPEATTEIVGGTEGEEDLAALDGPTDETDDSSSADTAPADDGTGDDGTGDNAPADAAPIEQGDTDESPDASTTSSGVAVDPAPTAAPPIPDFARAAGAADVAMQLPLDQGLPEHATFMGTWVERAVSYYAVSDQSTTCSDATHAEIRMVNGSGITQNVRDPQLRFSGEISHFAVQPAASRAAWVVACDSQLELYVATLGTTGSIDALQLAWIGEGSTSSALVIWDGDEVSLNAIAPDGKFFAAAYNVDTELVSRNGGPSRIMLEAGAPAERSLTPLAATADAGLTYWTGRAPAGTVSECTELYGSGVSDTLWLRQGEGQWLLAVAGDVPLATVTAAAIEPTFNQFALADVCENQPGRVLVGDQLPDGRIGDVREIDLTPYVPGFVAQLHWIDANTLRIETDNSGHGFGTVRFDYRIDEEIIVQLG